MFQESVQTFVDSIVRWSLPLAQTPLDLATFFMAA